MREEFQQTLGCDDEFIASVADAERYQDQCLVAVRREVAPTEPALLRSGLCRPAYKLPLGICIPRVGDFWEEKG